MKRIIILGIGILTLGVIVLGSVKITNLSGQKCQPVSIATATLATVSNMTEPDFLYEVSNRFMATVTKEAISQATTIADLVPARGMEERSAFRNVRIIVHPEADGNNEYGDTEVLNPAQKALLLSTDYSNTFNIEAHCTRTSAETGQVEQQGWGFHVSIIPEKEAEFKEGRAALLNYIKENTQDAAADIRKEQLRPGRVFFTINKEGNVSNIKLDSSSGFTNIDESMMALMTSLNGKWNPATNSKGEAVEQELVLFFGQMGC